MIYHGQWNLGDLSEQVTQATSRLRGLRSLFDFDSMVVIGISGLLVGAPVSLGIDCPLVIVRKEGVDCHDADSIVNIANVGKRYLFFDDLIASRHTWGHVVERIDDRGYPDNARPVCVGAFLYKSMELKPWTQPAA